MYVCMIHVSMCKRIYVCTYACMYVCTYICMHTYVRTYVVRTYTRIHVSRYVCKGNILIFRQIKSGTKTTVKSTSDQLAVNKVLTFESECTCQILSLRQQVAL